MITKIYFEDYAYIFYDDLSFEALDCFITARLTQKAYQIRWLSDELVVIRNTDDFTYVLNEIQTKAPTVVKFKVTETKWSDEMSTLIDNMLSEQYPTVFGSQDQEMSIPPILARNVTFAKKQSSQETFGSGGFGQGNNTQDLDISQPSLIYDRNITFGKKQSQGPIFGTRESPLEVSKPQGTDNLQNLGFIRTSSIVPQFPTVMDPPVNSSSSSETHLDDLIEKQFHKIYDGLDAEQDNKFIGLGRQSIAQTVMNRSQQIKLTQYKIYCDWCSKLIKSQYYQYPEATNYDICKTCQTDYFNKDPNLIEITDQNKSAQFTEQINMAQSTMISVNIQV